MPTNPAVPLIPPPYRAHIDMANRRLEDARYAYLQSTQSPDTPCLDALIDAVGHLQLAVDRLTLDIALLKGPKEPADGPTG